MTVKNESKTLKAAMTGKGAYDSRQLENIFEKCRHDKKKMTTLVRAFCEAYLVDNQNRPLKLSENEVQISVQNKKDKKYVPLSKRQDKPDSALWLIKNHSKLKDSQIANLVGITSASVKAIRNKSYWNFNNLNEKDPVAMGLFSQKDLIEAIEKAERRLKREKKEREKQQKSQEVTN